MIPRRSRMLPCVFAVVVLSQAGVPAAEWPHLRGPQVDGTVAAAGTFDSEAVALQVTWRIPLGSAYSGVAVASGRAVTLFAADGADQVAAFDAANGKPLWRRPLGEVTRGHDGSDDGPLSSPVIGGDRVYVLRPDGALHARYGWSGWRNRLDRVLTALYPVASAPDGS